MNDNFKRMHKMLTTMELGLYRSLSKVGEMKAVLNYAMVVEGDAETAQARFSDLTKELVDALDEIKPGIDFQQDGKGGLN